MNVSTVFVNHINAECLERTVKVIPDGGQTSYIDLLTALDTGHVDPKEVEGIFKVSASDNSFSVVLKSKEAVDKLAAQEYIYFKRGKFSIVKMSEQIVKLRVHWLPLFYNDSLLKYIFSDFGKVLAVERLKTAHERMTVLNGIREVTLKVNEIEKQCIPHIINFGAGQSMLVTLSGRPPLCLRCRTTGHVRRDCPRKTFSGLFTSNRESREAVTVRASAGPGVSGLPGETPVGSGGLEGSGDLERSGDLEGSEDLERSGDPVGVSLPAESGTGGTEAGGAASENRQEFESEDVEMGEKTLKRGRDLEEGGPWFSPNKTAKSRFVSQAPVPVSNSFEPILDILDIMSQDPDI